MFLLGVLAFGILHYLIRQSKDKPRFRYIIALSKKIKFIGDNIMISMSYSQKVSVELAPQDSNGNPATVEPGSVQVVSANQGLCTVVRDPNNELLFEVLGNNTGVEGATQVDISADADLGQGVVTITGFIGVEITPKQAVGFGFNIGEPIEQ